MSDYKASLIIALLMFISATLTSNVVLSIGMYALSVLHVVIHYLEFLGSRRDKSE